MFIGRYYCMYRGGGGGWGALALFKVQCSLWGYKLDIHELHTYVRICRISGELSIGVQTWHTYIELRTYVQDFRGTLYRGTSLAYVCKLELHMCRISGESL